VVLLRDCATIRRTSTGIALGKLLRSVLIGLAELSGGFIWELKPSHLLPSSKSQRY
jgi:hypothetical protein